MKKKDFSFLEKIKFFFFGVILYSVGIICGIIGIVLNMFPKNENEF